MFGSFKYAEWKTPVDPKNIDEQLIQMIPNLLKETKPIAAAKVPLRSEMAANSIKPASILKRRKTLSGEKAKVQFDFTQNKVYEYHERLESPKRRSLFSTEQCEENKNTNEEYPKDKPSTKCAYKDENCELDSKRRRFSESTENHAIEQFSYIVKQNAEELSELHKENEQLTIEKNSYQGALEQKTKELIEFRQEARDIFEKLAREREEELQQISYEREKELRRMSQEHKRRMDLMEDKYNQLHARMERRKRESVQDIVETKKKQWCSQCGSEAPAMVFCSIECQQHCP